MAVCQSEALVNALSEGPAKGTASEPHPEPHPDEQRYELLVTDDRSFAHLPLSGEWIASGSTEPDRLGGGATQTEEHVLAVHPDSAAWRLLVEGGQAGGKIGGQVLLARNGREELRVIDGCELIKLEGQQLERRCRLLGRVAQLARER